MLILKSECSVKKNLLRIILIFITLSVHVGTLFSMSDGSSNNRPSTQETDRFLQACRYCPSTGRFYKIVSDVQSYQVTFKFKHLFDGDKWRATFYLCSDTCHGHAETKEYWCGGIDYTYEQDKESGTFTIKECLIHHIDVNKIVEWFFNMIVFPCLPECHKRIYYVHFGHKCCDAEPLLERLLIRYSEWIQRLSGRSFFVRS